MVFVLGFIGLGVLGVLMDAGYAPSDRVVSASEMPDGHYEDLFAEGIIEQGESIEYFFSEGILSIFDGGSTACR